MVNLKQVKSFIQGNYRYFRNKLQGSPKYIQEQVYYRLKQCENDCLIVNKCRHCTCPPKRKAWSNESCNDGERFPDLMNADAWNKFKKDNNININIDD